MNETKEQKQRSVEGPLKENIILEEDQPYEVPKNWCFCYLTSVVKFSSGKSLTMKKMNPAGSIPVYGGNGVTGFHDSSNVENEKIVIGRVGFYCGSVHLTPSKAWVTDNALIASFTDKLFDKQYLYWNLTNLGLGKYSNSSAQPVISSKTLSKVPIPIAPLEEQRRIATKVNLLFSKIDEAKQLIEEVKESFELHRLSILKRAFRGELVNFTYKLEKLGSIVTLKSGNSLSEDVLSENGTIPYVKVSDMNSLENQREIVTANKYIKENEKFHNKLFPKGTVIFPKRGGAIHTNKKRILATPTTCDLNIMGIICPSTIHPFYMYYWMQSINLGSLDNGSSVPQINNKDIEPLEFPLTSMENQEKVVKLLDNIYIKEDNFIKIIESKLQQLEDLKQTVLNKAFRGELETNDLTEESAIELFRGTF
ncbi:restriction endonuclease subunit S [Bacillus sp. ISL-39]|uniref:restriction endonuclease subunit S n=1 Tax=Bacillus sp. ISL-39 TaxID=2819124 RepID=UPI001BE5EE7A|nr:restriction endonuclease subunit S [Bacillus sp. ISL-39]MBT2639365.1 restriction endonuclease subunit S [Bacillus sp. ISL-39]